MAIILLTTAGIYGIILGCARFGPIVPNTQKCHQSEQSPHPDEGMQDGMADCSCFIGCFLATRLF